MTPPIRKWYSFNRTSTLPTPGIPLLVELEDGTTCWAIRPDYVANYTSEPNFRDRSGHHITSVIAWAIY